jgi:hypothetical protein
MPTRKGFAVVINKFLSGTTQSCQERLRRNFSQGFADVWHKFSRIKNYSQGLRLLRFFWLQPILRRGDHHGLTQDVIKGQTGSRNISKV